MRYRGAYGANRNADIYLVGKNLNKRDIRVHTSFLKDFAPLPGRSMFFWGNSDLLIETCRRPWPRSPFPMQRWDRRGQGRSYKVDIACESGNTSRATSLTVARNHFCAATALLRRCHTIST